MLSSMAPHSFLRNLLGCWMARAAPLRMSPILMDILAIPAWHTSSCSWNCTERGGGECGQSRKHLFLLCTHILDLISYKQQGSHFIDLNHDVKCWEGDFYLLQKDKIHWISYSVPELYVLINAVFFCATVHLFAAVLKAFYKKIIMKTKKDLGRKLKLQRSWLFLL